MRIVERKVVYDLGLVDPVVECKVTLTKSDEPIAIQFYDRYDATSLTINPANHGSFHVFIQSLQKICDEWSPL